MNDKISFVNPDLGIIRVKKIGKRIVKGIELENLPNVIFIMEMKYDKQPVCYNCSRVIEYGDKYIPSNLISETPTLYCINCIDYENCISYIR